MLTLIAFEGVQNSKSEQENTLATAQEAQSLGTVKQYNICHPFKVKRLEVYKKLELFGQQQAAFESEKEDSGVNETDPEFMANCFENYSIEQPGYQEQYYEQASDFLDIYLPQYQNDQILF